MEIFSSPSWDLFTWHLFLISDYCHSNFKDENVYVIILNCEKSLTDSNLPSFFVAGGEVYQILWIVVPKVQRRCWQQVGLVGFMFIWLLGVNSFV